MTSPPAPPKGCAPFPYVACPTCGATTEFSPANRWRPFCSERCRMIDLGAWASETYRIEVVPDKGEPGSDDADPESR